MSEDSKDISFPQTGILFAIALAVVYYFMPGDIVARLIQFALLFFTLLKINEKYDKIIEYIKKGFQNNKKDQGETREYSSNLGKGYNEKESNNGERKYLDTTSKKDEMIEDYKNQITTVKGERDKLLTANVSLRNRITELEEQVKEKNKELETKPKNTNKNDVSIEENNKLKQKIQQLEDEKFTIKAEWENRFNDLKQKHDQVNSQLERYRIELRAAKPTENPENPIKDKHINYGKNAIYAGDPQNNTFHRLYDQFTRHETRYVIYPTSAMEGEFELVNDPETREAAFMYIDGLKDACELYGTDRPHNVHYRNNEKGKVVKEGNFWVIVKKLPLEW